MVRYRRDIDGLRALAIIPVILFHANYPIFSGGYVGVDVFFVISGYLITNNLMSSSDTGWRLLGFFYERRLRRIAPALLALLASLLIVSALFLPAVDLLRNGKNIIAALLFASNIRFYGKTGYFAGASGEEPLLHTWSLAVEEQYYLLFPLIVIILKQSSRRCIFKILLILAALSLLFSIAMLNRDPALTFYMLPTRAWELLAGAILAAAPRPIGLRKPLREVVSTLGLLLIVLPIFVYDSSTAFPGSAALLPVIGTVLVILPSEESVVGKVLSTRLLVFIGLISYSLYLWHWPILVIGRQLLGPLGAFQTIALLGLLVLTSLVSFWFVERPFRNRTSVPTRVLLAWTGIATSVIGAGAITAIASQGWPSRSPAAEGWYRSATKAEHEFQSNPCLAQGDALPPSTRCRLGISDQKFSGILWGDSHAAHWAPMVATVATNYKIAFRQMTKAGCPPIVTSHMHPMDPHRRTCPEFNHQVLQYILNDPDIHYVVLAANWQGITEGSVRIGGGSAAPPLQQSRDNAGLALKGVVEKLRSAGKMVLAIGQTPIPDENIVLCSTRRKFLGLSDLSCGHSDLATAKRRDEEAQKLLAPLATRDRANVLSPLSQFCSRGVCRSAEHGALYYIDSAHLSPLGAGRLGAAFAHELDAWANHPNLPKTTITRPKLTRPQNAE